MAISITNLSHPNLVTAMRAIEVDNGGHLIGTVYPGNPIDLDRFVVPFDVAHLLAPAERALGNLRTIMPDEFDIFATGEDTERKRIVAANPDIEAADLVIETFYSASFRLIPE